MPIDARCWKVDNVDAINLCISAEDGFRGTCVGIICQLIRVLLCILKHNFDVLPFYTTGASDICGNMEIKSMW